MKIYTIDINGSTRLVRASHAAVALHKAARTFKESQLIRTSFTVVSVRKLIYEYFFIAEIPCDPSGSYKRTRVNGPMATIAEAELTIDNFRAAHPDYQYVRVQKAEKLITI